MAVKLHKLAELVGGVLSGQGDIEIDSAAPIASARAGQITFLANKKYSKHLETTAASAVVLPPDITFERLPSIKHQNPYYAFALILDELYPDLKILPAGVDPAALVDDSAVLGQNVSIGPLTHIGRNCTIGDNTEIMANVYIGHKVKIGSDCRLYPGVVILDDTVIGDQVIIHSGTVVGSDGFGYAPYEGGLKKVKQIGWVEIDPETEIGANCTIDRGALGPTRIGKCVKIDNLVQIAHNVEIGDYSIIVAQVGISGSTRLGRNVILAGQVGLTGHIEIGDAARIGAQSGVHQNLAGGREYLGSPAREKLTAARIEASLPKLPELFRRVRKLEKKD